MKRVLSFLIILAVAFSMLPQLSFASDVEVQWKGAMNFNNANNYVTDIQSITAPNKCEMKWAYPLNDSVMAGGAYYAGQYVIVGDFLYATGGEKLHKINIKTGEGEIINSPVGSTVSYYDYLCYGDEVIYMATQTSIEAYDLNGVFLGKTEGAYGYYHPIIYNEGYVICNGFIYKTEKIDEGVTFTQIGESAIGGDFFNWAGGAFVNGLFYTVSKTTIYAVDYKTNTVVDSFTFDPSRTATSNVQGGLSYDETTSRFFFATYTYNNFIHSVKINPEDGKFITDSYISEDAKQKSVATPIVYNGRVYLAGQQGRISVHNADDLTMVYDYVTLGGGKVQGNSILSTAGGKVNIYTQCYNGHLYMFTDNGESGTAVQLAQTPNYTEVKYPYGGFEHIAMDKSGNIYCYNESGYLFCYGESECEIPTITKNLSEDRVKYAVGSETEKLNIEAVVSEGELSYKWQSSTDNKNWSDIDGATESEYTPSAEVAGTTYYRCVITNKKDGYTAENTSLSAYILVKQLSADTEINLMAGSSNSLTSGTRDVGEAGADGVYYIKNRTAKVTNVWLGVSEEGSIESFEVLQGTGNTQPKKYSVTNSDLYTARYYKNSYTLPVVGKVTAVAEDGVTESVKYIVISEAEPLKYIISAELNADEIRFTEENQTFNLSVSPKETIGEGELQNISWTFESSDPKVCTVDENGLVNNIGGGEAEITASCQNIKATVKVISETEAHTVHTYSNKKCSVCGTEEPDAVNVYFTVVGKDNEISLSKDGETYLNKLLMSVSDADFDGSITINDGFIILHKEHSVNGENDFVTEKSSYGLFITSFWGDNTSSVSYTLNNEFPTSLTTEIKNNDSVSSYFYADSVNYSDIYTYIEGQNTVAAKNETEYTVKGLSSSGNVIPFGATVKVFGSDGEEISQMATTVNNEGKFVLNFTDAGDYTVKVNGKASYSGKIWDFTFGDYADKEYSDSPVTLSLMEIKVIPFVQKTVYLTVSTKSGEFAVNKNGEEMWRFAVVATDTPSAPDGVVTITELLNTAHREYHKDGLSAFSGGSFITKLWGENNGGNCSYYFNDTYMTGSGVKTGTNGREWQDKLLNTVVEDGDSFSIYSFQATDWSKGDLYTYFNPISESAVAGTEKTFNLKSGGNSSNKLETSLVKVYDSNGNEISDMATTVDSDGNFKLTFASAGKYRVDISTNGNNYITPARLIVQVSRSGGGSGSGNISENKVYISVKAPGIKTYLNKTAYEISSGETAYSLLEKTELDITASSDNQFGGVYVEGIEGLSEFDYGPTSGWTYRVNGEYPECSSSLYEISEGDYVEWIYEKESSGGSYTGGGAASETTDKVNTYQNNFPDVSTDDWYYKAVKYVYENNLIKGTDKGFEPESNMTRAMLVTVLWRMEKEPSGESLMAFSDVKADEWYSDAINWATAKRIVSGIGNDKFGTDEHITREQMVTMLYRYSMMKNYNITSKSKADILTYSDMKEVSSYAFDGVRWAVSSGLIKGKGNNSLCPKDFITRGEIAEILMRFCKGI